MLDPPMQPTYIATCTRRVSPGQYENMSREEAIQGSLAVTTAPRPLTSARYRKTSCDNEWPVR